jgi:hypothetical protein
LVWHCKQELRSSPVVLGIYWLDRDRRYFVPTTSSLSMGDHVVCDRLHQLVKDKETPPEQTELNLTQQQQNYTMSVLQKFISIIEIGKQH